MPIIALFGVCLRRVTCCIAIWLPAISFAQGDPALVSALSKELDGHLWRIEFVRLKQSNLHYPDNTIMPRGDDGSDVYLSFKNGEISGNLGCGQFTGRYTLLQDGVQISARWNDDTKRCGSNLRQQAEMLTAALNGPVRLERGGEDAFHLFDEQRKFKVRLELLSPGADLSEFRATFWRLVSLEGNTIEEPNVEVRFNERTIGVSIKDALADFTVSYSSKKSSFTVHSVFSPDSHHALHNLFDIFDRTLREIQSYTLSGDKLAAFDQLGRQIMLLERIPPTGIEHRFWHITEYAEDAGGGHTFSTQFQFITFVRGKLQGTAGCTGLRGVYTLAGDSLSVQAGSLSLAGYCSDQAKSESRLVERALNMVSRVKQDGARMLLQDSQGNTNIVLTPYLRQTPR